MTVSERLKKRRLELGISAKELGERIGKNKTTIYRYENGSIENMPYTALIPLAKALNTTPGFLMGWDEDKGENKPCTSATDSTDSSFVDGFKQGVSQSLGKLRLTPVPVYDAISCGTGSWISERPEDFVGIPEDMLSKSGEYFANKAAGDSMEPKIHNGDYVVFEETPSLPSGAIGSFALNGEYYCKRFKRLPDGSCWLFSENPRYDPILITPEDEFHVLGKYKLRVTAD